MAQEHDERQTFTGFGRISVPKAQADEGVFILVICRDGAVMASAHATERGAMEAAAEYWQEERGDDEDDSLLVDYFHQAQRLISDEGGVMEIIPSPVHG